MKTISLKNTAPVIGKSTRRDAAVKVYFDVKLDGKTIIRKRLSKSFVAGFTKIIWSMWGAQNVTIVQTGGSSSLIGFSASAWGTDGPLDTSTRGIVVGTGTTAVTPADSKLATQIVTGNSSGQLRHMAATFNNLTSDSTTNSFQLIRPFVNNSGGSITVNEIGVYCIGVSSLLYCLIRDVLGVGVAVGNTQTLTITYTFSAAI